MDSWKVIYDEYDPTKEQLRESLCALGNGYFVTRAAAEESDAGPYHYPGTYLAGGYNRLETEVSGKVIENEDLVNWPNWLVLKFRIEDGEWITTENIIIISYRQELDLKAGTLTRAIVFTDEQKRETEWISRRIVSMRDPHTAVIEWKLTPKNWSGRITLHAALDGSVTNSGVERYRELNSKHLKVVETGQADEDIIFLQAETVQSEVRMAQASRLQIQHDMPEFSLSRTTLREDEYIAQEMELRAAENKTITATKHIAVFTSRDYAIAQPLLEAKQAVKRAGTFNEIQQDHARVWKEIWNRCDIVMEGEGDIDQLILRLHIFHIFQTCFLHIINLDVGVPARGWHGEAYRGHILWDELFIFPFLNLSLPEITQSLLLYRYRRLKEARHAAAEAGYQGAMYPWQSGSNGREESQVIHLNPQSGRWVPDNTYLQRHVNAAIAYNIWQYYQITGDHEFLSFQGIEMMLEIARFWASIATYSTEKNRYEIRHVVGPDEYHTQYPDAEEPGLNNNAYTNIMVVWSLMHAIAALTKIDDSRKKYLLEQLGITQEDIERWDKISRNMYVPFLENGVIEQFEGFDKLQDLDWKKYHQEHGEMLRLDRILEKEGDSVDRYKATKQADVLMLFYLFSAEELIDLFQRLGYTFDPARQIPLNIAYYQNTTSHGSTLSKLVYSWVLARSNREKSWADFRKALMSDFEDIQDGTTSEGIHLGAMAGTVDLMQRCYTGIEFRAEALWFNPQLPEKVKHLQFQVHYRQHWLEVDLTHEKLMLRSHGGSNSTITVVVNDRKYKLKKGQEKIFKYRKKASGRRRSKDRLTPAGKLPNA